MEATGTAATSLFWRMVGAAKLDRAVYEEIEHDRTATGQAAFVVVAASALGGLGSGEPGTGGLVAGVAAVIGWVVYANIALFIGTRLVRGGETKADWGEVARTLGFAHAPFAIGILALLPGVRGTVDVAVGLWLLAATVVALRAALDLSTSRAVVVGVISLLANYLALGAVLAAL